MQSLKVAFYGDIRFSCSKSCLYLSRNCDFFKDYVFKESFLSYFFYNCCNWKMNNLPKWIKEKKTNHIRSFTCGSFIHGGILHWQVSSSPVYLPQKDGRKNRKQRKSYKYYTALLVLGIRCPELLFLSHQRT